MKTVLLAIVLLTVPLQIACGDQVGKGTIYPLFKNTPIESNLATANGKKYFEKILVIHDRLHNVESVKRALEFSDVKKFLGYAYIAGGCAFFVANSKDALWPSLLASLLAIAVGLDLTA